MYSSASLTSIPQSPRLRSRKPCFSNHKFSNDVLEDLCQQTSNVFPEFAILCNNKIDSAQSVINSTISVMSDGVIPLAIKEGLEIMSTITNAEKQRRNSNNFKSWGYLYHKWLLPSLGDYITTLLSLLLHLCEVPVVYNEKDSVVLTTATTTTTAATTTTTTTTDVSADAIRKSPIQKSQKPINKRMLSKTPRSMKARSCSYTGFSSTANTIIDPTLELQVSIDNHTMLEFPYSIEVPRHQQIMFESITFILLSLLKSWKRIKNCGDDLMNLLRKKNAIIILLKVLNMKNPNLLMKQKKPSRTLRACDVFCQKIWGQEGQLEFQSRYDAILATAASMGKDSTLLEHIRLESQLRVYNGYGNTLRLLQKLVKPSPRHQSFLSRLNAQIILRKMLNFIMGKAEKKNKKGDKKKAKSKRLHWKGTLGRDRKKKQMNRTPKHTRKRMSLASKQEDDAPRARGRTIDAEQIPMDQTSVAERNTAKDTVALYILKLLKSIFRYLPEDWRMENMDVVTQIFHNVRINLHDDWISADSSAQLREDVMELHSGSGRMRKRTI